MLMWQTGNIGGCYDGSDMNSCNISDGSTSYVVMGLEEDSNYTIVVTLFNGSSAFSSNISATTQMAGKTKCLNSCQSMIEGSCSVAPTAPPTPVNTTATPTTITVQWAPVDCVHRNGDITGYSVQYMEVVNVNIHNMTVSGSNTTDATIINLMPSTMYIVQVAAINDAGDGVYSDPWNVSTNDSTEHSTTTAYEVYRK